jgi:hypothetical protein
MPVSGQVSHYMRETVIQIDCNQLGKTLITRLYEFVHLSRGLPFALFKDEFGQSHKARGTADAR